MRRRRILAAAGCSAAMSLAGCVDFDDAGTETPQGQWELAGRLVNEDGGPREWRVEARTERGNAAEASGTIPAGETWEFGLAGLLREEELEVTAGADAGATTATWRPTECPRFSAAVTISDGRPSLQLSCDDGQ